MSRLYFLCCHYIIKVINSHLFVLFINTVNNYYNIQLIIITTGYGPRPSARIYYYYCLKGNKYLIKEND
jgi:hypothetical protein